LSENFSVKINVEDELLSVKITVWCLWY